MEIDLFQPYRIENLEVKNRFMRSATWDRTADVNGTVTDKSVAIYRELARGGIGLIVTGFAYVSARGQAVGGQYGVHNDDMIPGLSRLVKTVHRYGSKIALQIVHAGILTRLEDRTALAVSQIPRFDRSHREMTGEEIEMIIGEFTAAARRAKEAGFDAVQLHGAHGYLMSQFLSPTLNLRQDRWGGSLENRSRFHMEVIRRIKSTVGRDFPLLIKFGIWDESVRGLKLEEGIRVARRMTGEGIAAIEVSAGVAPRTRTIPALKPDEPESLPFRDRAKALKQEVNVPVILVGGIRSLATAKAIVNGGDADMISMCRPFIREPGLLKRWQSGDTGPARCISCDLCIGQAREGDTLMCHQRES